MPEAESPEPTIAAAGRGNACVAVQVIALVALAGYGLVGRWNILMSVPGFNDGIYGAIASNYVKYGYPDFALAQITSPGAPVAPEERQQYQTHPPLVSLMSSLAVAGLGRSAWAVRLPHMVCELAGVVVLACLAGRLFGRSVGLWVAALGAALPVAVFSESNYLCPMGPTLSFLVCLAVWFYVLYAESGKSRYYVALLVVGALAVLTEWVACVLCGALAAHALVYRTRARRAALLALPGIAVAAFLILWLYARSIPSERQLFHSLDKALTDWTVTTDGVPEAPGFGPAEWAARIGRNYLIFFSPLGVLGLLWMLWRAPGALLRRTPSPVQYLLLLWGWPVPYVAVFHRNSFVHPYYLLLFLPGLVVTLGVLADRLCGASTVRWRGVRAALALAGCLFVAQWSHYALTGEQSRLDELRERYVGWSADLADHAGPEQEVGLALHYTRQMRFLADRRVRESIDSAEELEALKAGGGGAVDALFVPMAFPVGDTRFGRDLVAGHPFVAGTATLRFKLDARRPGGQVATQRLAGISLDRGLELQELAYAAVAGDDGREALFLGPALAKLPKRLPGEKIEWYVRFLDGEGRDAGSASMTARAAASYFIVAPEGWSREKGGVELRLRHHATDAASVGPAKRLIRLALRLATFGVLGNAEPRVREFLVEGKSPIVLSRL